MENKDDLLKDIKQARETQSRLDKVKTDTPRWHVFLYQFFHAIDYVLSKYLPPVRWVLFKLFRLYRALWAFFVYKRDENKVLVFSKTRAGIFLVASVFYLWFGLVPTVKLGLDASMYVMTVSTDEKVYLYNSQEIDSINNIHSVQGTVSIPIDESNSIYFRIESTEFNHMWSLFNKGQIFYADYIAAAVPNGLNKCTITSYGFRLKTLMRTWEIYPYILSASCTPVNPNNV